MIALACSLFLGFAAVVLIWPDTRYNPAVPGDRRDPVLQLALIGPVGLGISSLLWFARLILFGSPGPGWDAKFTIFEILLIAGVFVFPCIFPWKRDANGNAYEKRIVWAAISPPVGRHWRTLILAMLPMVLVASLAFVINLAAQAASDPYGDWDAWAMWNYRARVILGAGDQWREIYAQLPWTSHPDYPLMLPCAVARTWAVGGTQSPYVPFAISVIFSSSLVLLIFGALRTLRSAVSGMAAAIVLLCTPAFVHFAGAQYADLPLAFYLLAPVVCFALYDCKGYPPRILVLAGLCAGLAAWTKNEGIAFIVILALLRIAAAIVRRSIRGVAREFAPLAAGAGAALLALAYFKLTLAHSNYLTQGGSLGGPASQMSSVDRVETIVAMLGKFGRNFGNWAVITQYRINVVPWVPMVFYALFAGVKLSKEERPAFLTAFGAVLLMLAAYCAVYYITPLNLEWQMSKSVARLLLQIWPVFLFAYFLLVRPPEAVLEKS